MGFALSTFFTLHFYAIFRQWRSTLSIFPPTLFHALSLFSCFFLSLIYIHILSFCSFKLPFSLSLSTVLLHSLHGSFIVLINKAQLKWLCRMDTFFFITEYNQKVYCIHQTLTDRSNVDDFYFFFFAWRIGELFLADNFRYSDHERRLSDYFNFSGWEIRERAGTFYLPRRKEKV